MVLTAEQFRQRRALQKYARNAAGNLVRASAFRECDYAPSGALREFATEGEALAFDAARFEDGTGYRVRFSSEPKATVCPEQLALREAVRDAVVEEDLIRIARVPPSRSTMDNAIRSFIERHRA